MEIRKDELVFLYFCSSLAGGHRRGHLSLSEAVACSWQTLGAWQHACKKWNRNLIKFHKGKFQILHLRLTNPLHRSRLGSAWLGSSSAGKAQEVLVGSGLNVSQGVLWQQGWSTASWAY